MKSLFQMYEMVNTRLKITSIVVIVVTVDVLSCSGAVELKRSFFKL